MCVRTWTLLTGFLLCAGAPLGPGAGARAGESAAHDLHLSSWNGVLFRLDVSRAPFIHEKREAVMRMNCEVHGPRRPERSGKPKTRQCRRAPVHSTVWPSRYTKAKTTPRTKNTTHQYCTGM